MEDNENEIEIKYYVEMAFKEGIEKALKKIKKTGNSFLLDAFHDKLIEEIKKKKETKKN